MDGFIHCPCVGVADFCLETPVSLGNPGLGLWGLVAFVSLEDDVFGVFDR